MECRTEACKAKEWGDIKSKLTHFTECLEVQELEALGSSTSLSGGGLNTR